MTPRVEILSAVVATVDIFTTSSPPLSGVCVTKGRKEGRKESRTNEDSKSISKHFSFSFFESVEYFTRWKRHQKWCGGRAASSHRPPHVGTAPLDPLRSSAFDGFFSLSVSSSPSSSLRYIRRGFFCKRPLLTPYRSWLLEMEPLAHRAITKLRGERELGDG